MSEQRETKAGQRWMLAAFFVFVLLLLLWIAAAFLLNSASAGSLPFSVSLRSRLAANYSPDEFSGSQGVFRLSIFNEVFHDLGLSPEEAEERSDEIKVAMGSPVPTATARNFEGDDPFTPTSTDPPSSTLTPEQSITPTSTNLLVVVKSPTKTPIPVKPTSPAAKTPTLTGPSPTPTRCWVNPVVEILYPPDGSVYTTADEIPAQAFAYDPDNVDPDTCQPIGAYPGDDGIGIDKVEFKIYWVDGTEVLVHSQDQLSIKYCGFMGTPFCNTYPVSNPYWPDGFTPLNDGLHKLKVRAKDDGGNYSDWVWVYFTLDLGAPATDTPTPTNTPTATATATSTPTSTSTPTPTDTPTPDPCSLISITGPGISGDRASWQINNGGSTDITIDLISLAWPPSNGNLEYVRLEGDTIWNLDYPPPSVTITSGWTGMSRVINFSSTEDLEFEFYTTAEPTGYSVSLTFDNGCVLP